MKARIRVRPYDQATDFAAVGQLLLRTYGASGSQANWLQPRWEYMHYHPLIAGVELHALGIWEADGAIVAVVHPEHCMGQAYFEVDPAHADLKRDMLAYAEERLCAASDTGKELRIYVNDKDTELQHIAAELGYQETGEREPLSHRAGSDPIPSLQLPDGFRLKSLADDNDLSKIQRVLWRGFDHGDEPPDDGLAERRFMQSAPSFRKDLTIVVEAPDGNFVSYCGMWHEPVNRIAYVEPVATDPDYRRMGLGRAAVLEGVRRCARLGATGAYVGSAMPFYQSLGFRQVYRCSVWRRRWA